MPSRGGRRPEPSPAAVRDMNSYFSSTRSPWANLVFLAPLLALYECGVVLFGNGDPSALRNGADVWLRWGLARYGVAHPWAAPALVVVVLVVRTVLARKDRPADLVTACFGMAVESVLFAVGLWAVARNFDPLLKTWGVLPAASVGGRVPAAGQLVTYVGAGIYEEVLFRLGLFALLWYLLRLVAVPSPAALVTAAVAAAVVFAAAHHIGPTGEEVAPARFLFRVTAGLYFTVLYVSRGFGIAVGTHAGYDVLVGVSVG